MEITQEQLDRVVVDVVSKKYQPRSPDRDGVPPPLTNINVITYPDFLKRYLCYRSEESLLTSVPRAITINWGLLRKTVRIFEADKWSLSHTMYICNSIPGGMLQLTFIILHEIGHIDWVTRRGESDLLIWKEEEQELYADIYAFDRLKEIYDRKLAYSLLTRYGSASGWGTRKGKEDA